jgi:hypothetical protein
MTNHSHTLDSIEPGEYADLLPEMDSEAKDRLKASIEQHGFDETEPIRVTPDGTIVDGHHRYEACEELGVDPRIEVVEDIDTDYAVRVNLARRDHGDGGKRETVARWMETGRYDEDMSQREVAERLGVSRSTVRRAEDIVDGDIGEEGGSADPPQDDTDGDSFNTDETASESDAGSKPEGTTEVLDESGDAPSPDAPDGVEDATADADEPGAPELDPDPALEEDDSEVDPVAEDTTPPEGDTTGTLDSDVSNEPTNMSTREVADEWLREEYGFGADGLDERLSDTDRTASLVGRIGELESQIKDIADALENKDIDRLEREVDRARDMI